jgi:OmcA/MtrC family decaheme c-type cytochrome
VAYTTQNLTNPGTGNDPSLPIELDYLSAAAALPGTLAIPGGPPVRNADDTYTMAGATPIPGGLVGGSGVAYLEGRTIVDVDPSPSVTQMARVGVTASAGVSYPITDVTAVPPRQVVDIARCDECHNRLLFHDDSRNDSTGLCATCHNPNFAEGTTAATGQPWDFKVLIHALHASTYNYGGVTLPPIQYPGYVQNCEGCHKPGTYYPVDPTAVFASSIDQGADPSSPSDDTAITPNSAVCSTCHTSSDVRLHMELKGGSFNATKNADGTSDQAALETCGSCHGEGGPVDVKVMHHIDDYRYNN